MLEGWARDLEYDVMDVAEPDFLLVRKLEVAYDGEVEVVVGVVMVVRGDLAYRQYSTIANKSSHALTAPIVA